MKKILVTGANGQLGFQIRKLLTPNYKLILTDADNMDITNKSKVQVVIKSERPDLIIHGAAYTQVDKAEDNEELCRKINSEGTKNIAEAANENNSTLIYISTDYVFDGKKDSPYTENDKPNPLSVYGQTKSEGEEYIRKICTKYYILRIAWLFGELPENAPGTNFIETMLRLSRERESLNIVNDQIGSPTYTKDLVEIIGRILTHQPTIPFDTYHFSGHNPCSWYDFAKEIFALKKINIKLSPITSDQYPQKAKRPAYSYLSKDKIEKALDIKIRPWQEMVEEYLKSK